MEVNGRTTAYSLNYFRLWNRLHFLPLNFVKRFNKSTHLSLTILKYIKNKIFDIIYNLFNYVYFQWVSLMLRREHDDVSHSSPRWLELTITKANHYGRCRA